MSSISVFGLGYVGTVTVACLADSGHEVIGVDVNPTKVDIINAGRSPIVEEGLSELIHQGVQSGRIQATTDAAQAIQASSLSIICVGTPSNPNDSLNLSYVERVSCEIGEILAAKSEYHIIVVRSTMLPGSTEKVVIPLLEQASGKKAGADFGVCYNPEFLREGSSIKDFYDPPFTVLGGDDERAIAGVSALYGMLTAELIVVPIKVAEMVKYSSNAFHALKVTFANEIGNICKKHGIDSHQVMDIFCRDTKLNISTTYLKPGFAFGGSCLPKDLKALLYHARQSDLDVPVLESVVRSNRQQIEIAYRMVRATKRKRIGALGISFKAGTDDLRESPMVELLERLIGKGYDVKVYDRNVSLAELHGANRTYIEHEIPHIASLMCDSIDEVQESSDVLIIGNRAQEFQEVLRQPRPGQILIDLVRFPVDTSHLNGQYEGICW